MFFTQKKNSAVSIVFVIIFTLASCSPLHQPKPSGSDKAATLEERYAQDAFAYSSDFSIDPDIQEKFSERFLELYFAPWNSPDLLIDDKEIDTFVRNSIQRYQKKPGWTDYLQHHSVEWVDRIKNNMRWSGKPDMHKSSITITDSYLRILPTHESSFTNWTSAGEGYPFDNLQISYIPAYTPITKLHVSLDKAWTLILTRHGGGWIPSKNLVELNEEQVGQWQNSRHIVVTKENQVLLDDNGIFRGYARIGVLYPLSTSKNDLENTGYQLQLFDADQNRVAQSVIANLSTSGATLFPMPMNKENMANVMNNLLGEPYGWGGHLGFRDCSSINQDYFSTFGLWVPRNSVLQMQSGTPRRLDTFNSFGKQQQVIKYGLPFLTFVGIPGHMMLYIGTHDGQAYAMHTLWGLKTYDSRGQEGRMVIGRTVITPLEFGDGEKNVYQSLLSKATAMTNLVAQESIQSNN
jgi:hypothetical protein